MNNAVITLYFIPSPFGLSWETPTSLARSIVLNKYSMKPRFMGHVNIDLKFTNSENKNIHILTGMVAKELNAVPLLLKEKMGLGILWHSFPGRLETKEELIPELKSYKETGKRINFIRYNITQKQAQRLYDYYKTYKDNNIEKYYGLVNSPLHAEGGGCSAFGASFLAVANLLDKEFTKNSSTSVRAPLDLIGAPITKNHPSFLKLLIQKRFWAKENEDHKEIHFWDPDLMFKYVQKLINKHSHKENYQVVFENKAQGIEYPLRETVLKDKIFFSDTVSKHPDINKKSNLDFFTQVTG